MRAWNWKRIALIAVGGYLALWLLVAVSGRLMNNW